jgi:carbamoylphosphate synthase small subunit
VCLDELTNTQTLYRDDFLTGFTLPDCPDFDEWQFFQNEGLRQQLAQSLEQLITLHIEQHTFETAIPYARRWLVLDPLHEHAHQQLMRLYAWSGQWAAALRQFETCVRLLDTELGVPPSPETRQLNEAIKTKQLSRLSSSQVSIKEKHVYGNGKYKIVLVDCGVKYNIIRNLTKRDATVILVPWDYDFSKEEYDGLFISNGPGDPKKCDITIHNIKAALGEDKPIFGICLGNQLLALAAGADSYKLKYGHRSHNQPVIQVGTKRSFITSQNHGYAIDNNTLPKEWEPLFINLNDNTNEGMKHKSKPFFSSQFHPEASSGPTDTEFLFDQFMDLVKPSSKV